MPVRHLTFVGFLLRALAPSPVFGLGMDLWKFVILLPKLTAHVFFFTVLDQYRFWLLGMKTEPMVCRALL
jgi:hypothetical protein